jgi:hypothetical protein
MHLFTVRQISLLDYLGGAITYIVKVFEISTSKYKKFAYCTSILCGPLMVAQWLRYCVTNRKVVGSLPDGVLGIFH